MSRRAGFKIPRSAALQGCPAAVGRPKGLRYHRPPLILKRGLRHLVTSATAALVASLIAIAVVIAQTKTFKPVTDATLQRPDPGDWINWRRTLDGWGFSPLDQITTKNVHQLQMVWSRALGPGISEPTPLVYEGVMYIPSPNGLVQALDAVTGDFLWEFNRESRPLGYGVMRSLAIYDDKIYVPTRDAHVIALNARTGTVVWDRTVADSKLGYHYGSGPLIVRGKVVVGIQGCQTYKNDICFISAYDAQSGREVWRTSTIARPGEPDGDTWGDLPLMFRAGGDAWITGSYDPALNLIYWSTAQAKPWAQFQRGDGGASALYTNSTLALDPDSGKIVWYHQFIPGESHDMDEVFESVLIDHDGRRSLFKMGKLGILWELDRTTGKFVAAHDLGYQTLYELNRATGQLKLREEVRPKAGVELSFCPSLLGLKGWQAMAYYPPMQALFVPLNLACVKVTFTDIEKKEGGSTTGIRGMSHQPHPASPENNGELVAMDIRSGRVLWRHATPTRMQSAVLTTAGGLVVAGDWDRYVYVHEATTGKVLFQTRMPSAVQGFPITYAVNGRQYLAVPVGSGSALFNMPTQLAPSRRATPPGNAIFVFALPDRSTPATQ
jgi:alcohol dehydrogenase (cytochrome c)